MGFKGDLGDDGEDVLASNAGVGLVCGGGEDGSVGGLDGIGVGGDDNKYDVAAAGDECPSCCASIASAYLGPEGSN